MMNKLLITLLALPVVLALLLWFGAGIAPWALGESIAVGTAMGAKLGCSARYLSGLAPDQIIEDLTSYSPANQYLDIHYSDERVVTASLFGLAETQARYREGLGCALLLGDSTVLDDIDTESIESTADEWPLGETVSSIDEEYQQRLDAMLRSDNEAGFNSRALLMVRGGKVVAESYAPGFDSSTPLLGWSMGKSLTAIMLGQLELQGLVSRDETGLFEAWSDARSEISVTNLLQMSSGLDFQEIYTPGHDATRMLFLSPSASGVAMASPLAHAPGEHFYYSSGTTNLLARLLSDRLGGPQASADFLGEQILRPLGMANTVLEMDPAGHYVGSSYIYASARDWARLAQLMLNGGELNGIRLLSEEWVAAAQQPNSSTNDPRYGYQFWLNGGGEKLSWPDLPEDAYAMLGNRKQVVMIVPSADTIIVRLGWSWGQYPTSENFAALLR